MKKISSFILLAIFSLTVQAQPKLVVQIVVDQLRGDLIQQYRREFGQQGFNYLLNHGINYQNAHHPHANTTTCAGHATISTGSYPSMHGIVDNEWYDRTTQKLMYCMSDPQSPLLPTNHTKNPSPGRSPLNLVATTLSDEIVLANMGKSFGVSFKDRSAIALAGHAGKAFWYDKENNGFVTSSWYYQNYPQWVISWNKGYTPIDYHWKLGFPLKSYTYAKSPRSNVTFEGYNDNFPHQTGIPSEPNYIKRLSMTPYADELTAEFAMKIIDNERLGKTRGKTDYLGISFSATDAVGHAFGPESLESEDNLRRLDLTLAKLLKHIDQKVGLANTLIVLSADHGVADTPAYLEQKHIRTLKPLDIKALENFIRQNLVKQFNVPAKALLSINPPYVYLNSKIIHSHQLSVQEVSLFLAETLSTQPGIYKAYTLPISLIEKDWISTKVDRMSYPVRAGDIYLVAPPYQSIVGEDVYHIAHGSPWQYDSYVPLIFSNPRFRAQQVGRKVYTTDIASTLAELIQIKSPSAAVGRTLPEVVETRKLFQ